MSVLPPPNAASPVHGLRRIFISVPFDRYICTYIYDKPRPTVRSNWIRGWGKYADFLSDRILEFRPFWLTVFSFIKLADFSILKPGHLFFNFWNKSNGSKEIILNYQTANTGRSNVEQAEYYKILGEYKIHFLVQLWLCAILNKTRLKINT